MKKVIVILVIWFVSLTLISLADSGISYQTTERIRVEAGDSLYSIASTLGSHNTNALVYEIRQLNDLECVLITPGQEIEIPVIE